MHKTDMQEESWNRSQPTLQVGATVRTSAFVSMCLADDDLVGDQHRSGGLVSSSQVTMTSNPVSSYNEEQPFIPLLKAGSNVCSTG
jgi:hypothetical protein